MTIITRKTIFCENPACEMQLEYADISDRRIREHAKNDGWERIRGEDYCAQCVADGEFDDKVSAQ